ncbi:hypothetical protein HAZT_HAZT011068 [Hyalella azteca]|uniref:Teneurin TTR-like domain-containing protein n=1 Tax=Hyalella azteca TaxID=294128 RepID=A0A6A0HBN0_HYAAZ|nr:hypothetical protein HAZT_HAZT011068 [Hyalella azteca]
MVSTDPVEVLLRRQPMAVTASFFQRVKFLIEDRNVQSFARASEFLENFYIKVITHDPSDIFLMKYSPAIGELSCELFEGLQRSVSGRTMAKKPLQKKAIRARVSVIRGRVVSANGEGIVGVRTSVDKQSKYGLTATRKGGWFDLLLNGGGAVTLQFQRANFQPKTVTVPVIWNDIVVLDPIVLTLKSLTEEEKPTSIVGSQWSSPCLAHDSAAMRPQVVSTHLPHTVGGAAQQTVVFSEMQHQQPAL